jgi:hypothetical protein
MYIDKKYLKSVMVKAKQFPDFTLLYPSFSTNKQSPVNGFRSIFELDHGSYLRQWRNETQVLSGLLGKLCGIADAVDSLPCPFAVPFAQPRLLTSTSKGVYFSAEHSSN